MHESFLLDAFWLWTENWLRFGCVPLTDENLEWSLLFHPRLWGVKDPILGQILTKLQNKFSGGITPQISQFPANYGLHNRQEQAGYGRKSSRVSGNTFSCNRLLELCYGT